LKIPGDNTYIVYGVIYLVLIISLLYLNCSVVCYFRSMSVPTRTIFLRHKFGSISDLYFTCRIVKMPVTNGCFLWNGPIWVLN